MKTQANLQRMVFTGARLGRPHWLEVCSRGASIPSGVEPARRKFVQGRSYAFCFFGGHLPSGTYVELPLWGRFYQGLPSAKSKQSMKAQRHVAQSAAMARRASGSKFMPEPSKLRRVRRAAAGFNQSPEATAVGTVRSAGAVHVASRRGLGFGR